MDNPAIVAAWAAAIAAVVGPILGVVMANSFSRHESTRIAASSLFRSVVEHSHRYRHCFDEVVYRKVTTDINHNRVERLKHIPTSQDRVDFTTDLYNASVEAHSQAVKELGMVEAFLQADILDLELLFEKKSAKCVGLIRELVAIYDDIGKRELIELQQQTNDTVQRICNELQPLHRHVRKEDPLSFDQE